MATRVNFGIADNGNERGYFGYAVADATDGATYTEALDARGDMALIIAALSLGVLQTQSINVSDTLSSDKATSVWANREMGVRFIMESAAGDKATATLPAPDLSKFPFATLGTDLVSVPYDSPHADVTLMIAALEADAVHPITGDALVVTWIEQVGRNL